jgi:UDP-2,3-diacylglucosamine pyrophosphatase LpxH
LDLIADSNSFLQVMMIIIADAHVDDAGGNQADFFLMLRAIEKTNHDVIFLGDIFDLWIALPRYEKDCHKAFLVWCKEQKKHRTVGFIEGNHEFFVAEEKKYYFSWCSHTAYWRDEKGNLFCHGDQINRSDKNYLRFRKFSKNKISKAIARFLPCGPYFGELLKRQLKKTNLDFRRHLPEKAIAQFAEAKFNDGVHTIYVAHFHQDYRYRDPHAKALYILPGWFQTKQVTLYETESDQICSLHWHDLTGPKQNF